MPHKFNYLSNSTDKIQNFSTYIHIFSLLDVQNKYFFQWVEWYNCLINYIHLYMK